MSMVPFLIAKAATDKKKGKSHKDSSSSVSPYHPGYGASASSSKSYESSYDAKDILSNLGNIGNYASYYLKGKPEYELLEKIEEHMKVYLEEVTKPLNESIEEKKQKVKVSQQKDLELTNEFLEKMDGKFNFTSVSPYSITCKENNETFHLDTDYIAYGKNPFSEIYRYESSSCKTLETDIQEQRDLIEKLTKRKLLLKLSKKRQAQLETAKQQLAKLEKVKSRLDTCKLLAQRYELYKEDITPYFIEICSLKDQRLKLNREIEQLEREAENYLKYGVYLEIDYKQKAYEYALSQLSNEEIELFNSLPEVIYNDIKSASSTRLEDGKSSWARPSSFNDFIIDKIAEDVIEIVDSKKEKTKTKPDDELIK